MLGRNRYAGRGLRGRPARHGAGAERRQGDGVQLVCTVLDPFSG